MDAAIERLELGSIKAALRDRVRTPLGGIEVQALGPLATITEARERIEAIRQARLLLAKEEAPPVSGAQDVRVPLGLGEKGVMLEGPALRAIADTMRAGSWLRGHLLGFELEAPLLYGMAAALPDLIRVADSVSRSFDPDGQLADDASPDLGALRRRVRALRDSIKDQITSLLSSSDFSHRLQESYFTIRGDRYVLPIKSQFKNEVKGIVHDASGSGQTVFIEPAAVVDLGNRLKIAQSEQQEEEHRILSLLTVRVVEEADGIREMMRVLGAIDLITAAARLSVDLDCAPIVPSSRPGFDLIEARHPMLLLQVLAAKASVEAGAAPAAEARPATQVVGNDLGLAPGQRILILTGPNTGGKTVAMKTVGLLALMVRTGLHVPCSDRSSIGWFDRIEVAIGDQQSISSHLSTFAAHMKMLVETLGSADDRTLVLIDEIAADTDPTQGQALAQSILEQLAERGAHTIVTTHFERLKAVPFSDPRFRNAGVGFDAKNLRPTYKVTLDMPQSSSGFDIAQSLGLPGPIVERARELSGAGTEALERLMLDLQARATELEAARRQSEKAEREAAEEKVKLQEVQRRMEREKEEIRRKLHEEVMEELAASRAEVRRIIGALQASADSTSPREAMRVAQETAQSLAKLEEVERAKAAALSPEARAAEPLQTVEVGAWVHVKQLGKDGEVVAVEGKEAQVAVGSLRMRVPVGGLLPPRGKRPKKGELVERGRLRRELTEARGNRSPSGPRVTEELDLRGHAIDESLDRLDAFLDAHYGTPTTHVRIVHGHGTGALRMAIRAHLKASGYVKNLRPGDEHEGGDGATIVELS